MMRRCCPAVACALLLPLGFLPILDAAPGDTACLALPTFFLGVVYDVDAAASFRADVANVHEIRERIALATCLDDTYAAELSFAAASEAAVKAQLRADAAVARSAGGGLLVVVLSSHGLPYAGFPPCEGAAAPPGRHVGSFALLAPGAGEDGNFYDCELGDILTEEFPPQMRMIVIVDCSVCGGFSDSTTIASGTSDASLPLASSRVPGAHRVVMTGCAMTSECFGQPDGSVLLHHLVLALRAVHASDGTTAPGFPTAYGADAPVRSPLLRATNGELEASEWFFAAVSSAITRGDVFAAEQQFRMRYGFAAGETEIRLA